jgi:hypothetical protein
MPWRLDGLLWQAWLSIAFAGNKAFRDKAESQFDRETPTNLISSERLASSDCVKIKAKRFSRPRKARAGYILLSTGLGMVLGIIVLSEAFKQVAAKERAARVEALAVVITDLAADFDLYVHQNRASLLSDLAASSTNALVLDASQAQSFLSGGGSGSWRLPVTGSVPEDTSYSIGFGGIDVLLAVATSDVSDQPVGVFVMREQMDGQTGLVQDLRAALNARAADYATSGIGDPEPYAASLIGAPLSDAQLSIATPAYSGLNKDLLLREARAGLSELNVAGTHLAFDAASPAASRAVNVVTALDAEVLTATRVGCADSMPKCVDYDGARIAGDSPVGGAPDLGAISVTGDVSIVGRSLIAGLSSSAPDLAAKTLASSGMLSADTATITNIPAISGTTLATLDAQAAEIAALSARSVVAHDAAVAAPTTAGAPATPATLNVNSAGIKQVTADEGYSLRTVVGENATKPTPLDLQQMISINVQFGHVNTGSCLGC